MIDNKIIGEEPKSVKTIKKIYKIINTIICVIAIPIILINVIMFIKTINNKNEVPSICGFKYFVVLSGSMESTINIGDLIVIKETPENQIKENDIVTFKQQGTNITHRIIKIENVNNEKLYTTKGDNNNTEDDDKIKYENIQGKYLFKINKIGNLISFLRTLPGIIILVAIPVCTTIISYNIDKKKLQKKMKRKTKRIAHEKRK